MSSKILIMSGTSEIAQELAKLYVSKRTTLLVHGRNQRKLDETINRLQKLDPEAEIIGLPTIDLIHPKLEDMVHQNFESIYDSFYEKWFDDIVMKYGLPSHMVIAGGGGSGSASSIIELNAVSAIKCCENYVRKIRDHVHNEKYKNKKFHIVYMNSFLGERPDLWDSAVIYGQAKRCVKEYLTCLRETTKDLNLCVQNAILGPIDTDLLRSFYVKMDRMKLNMGTLERFFHNAMMFVPSMFTVSKERAAQDLKTGVEACESEFFVPTFFSYVPHLLDMWPNIVSFFTNGILFAIIFIPQYRNMILGMLKKLLPFMK